MSFRAASTRRRRRVRDHLLPRLPYLMRLARMATTPETRWEIVAFHTLRSLIHEPRPSDSYIASAVTEWLQQQIASYPALMQVDVQPTRDFSYLLKTWEPQIPEEDKTIENPVNEPETCPVCLEKDLMAEAQPCKHQFCDSCLLLCAKAKPLEVLQCPLCRQDIAAQIGLNGLTVEPLPTPLPLMSRPRINEQWLTERELAIYLSFMVPVLAPNASQREESLFLQ